MVHCVYEGYWVKSASQSKGITNKIASKLRPRTTRECVYLVTRGHIRSRDKDGGHTIRSAIAENPMLHANFTALCVYKRE